MFKRKLIKRQPAPAVVQLLGRPTKAPPLLPLLLFLFFVWRCSSSVASQHLDLFDEGFGVEGVHDVSRPEAVASATAGGDGRDGEGASEQVLNPGLGPVNMEWIRGAGKKFGLQALGSAVALLLLAVFVAAPMFAVALPKEKSFPTAPQEEGRKKEEEEKEDVSEEEKGEETPRSKDLKDKGEWETAGGEKEQEDKKGEFEEERAAAQLERLRRLQRCVPHAVLLDDALNGPRHPVFQQEITKHVETATKHQTAAANGEPGALAALTAENQEAERLALNVQNRAWKAVSANVRTLASCTSASVVAGIPAARFFLKKTGVILSYHNAWEQAVELCQGRIVSLQEAGETIEKRRPGLPSLQQKQLMLQPRQFSAARVALKTSLSCVKWQDRAQGEARKLGRIYLKLVKSARVAELELQQANLTIKEQVASMLIGIARASLEDGTRPLSAEEANCSKKWDNLYRGAQAELTALEQQLQALKDTTNLVDITNLEPGTARASERAGMLLQGLLNKLSKFLSSQTSLSANQLPNDGTRMEDVVSGAKQVVDLSRAVKPIVEAVTATEKQVLEVGHQLEMQLSGLKNLPWVPQLLLENAEKELKSVLESEKVTREAIEDRVTAMGRIAPSDISTSLDALEEYTSALTETYKTMGEVNADVETLFVLKKMVENAHDAKESALEMIAASSVLQPADHQLVGQLEKQLEHAVATGRQADSLSGVVQAVGEYASASGKLVQMGWVSKLDSLLESDPEGTTELQAIEAVPLELQSTAAEVVAQDRNVEQEKAQVQAAATTTVGNQREDFSRQTKAETQRGEDHEEEVHDGGEGGDDQTGYETASKSAGDEGSESGDEYEDAQEWAGSS
ncbi:hypothetical protein EMWEY_00034710 [Eimeria maxima]|uniref:Transmembrane protein n=1 Tax=Eimeria maxima TaxID=5804 RepID=U6MGJ4_EIMMA|nr:hypothetical protein EMWEY_00034710 [Eimeria maxima]CDJ60770.1 hypothetical protein EMWEY_00034710 [Eimeria maxima]